MTLDNISYRKHKQILNKSPMGFVMWYEVTLKIAQKSKYKKYQENEKNKNRE